MSAPPEDFDQGGPARQSRLSWDDARLLFQEAEIGKGGPTIFTAKAGLSCTRAADKRRCARIIEPHRDRPRIFASTSTAARPASGANIGWSPQTLAGAAGRVPHAPICARQKRSNLMVGTTRWCIASYSTANPPVGVEYRAGGGREGRRARRLYGGRRPSGRRTSCSSPVSATLSISASSGIRFTCSAGVARICRTPTSRPSPAS